MCAERLEVEHLPDVALDAGSTAGVAAKGTHERGPGGGSTAVMGTHAAGDTPTSSGRAAAQNGTQQRWQQPLPPQQQNGRQQWAHPLLPLQQPSQQCWQQQRMPLAHHTYATGSAAGTAPWQAGPACQMPNSCSALIAAWEKQFVTGSMAGRAGQSGRVRTTAHGAAHPVATRRITTSGIQYGVNCCLVFCWGCAMGVEGLIS